MNALFTESLGGIRTELFPQVSRQGLRFSSRVHVVHLRMVIHRGSYTSAYSDVYNSNGLCTTTVLTSLTLLVQHCYPLSHLYLSPCSFLPCGSRLFLMPRSVFDTASLAPIIGFKTAIGTARTTALRGPYKFSIHPSRLQHPCQAGESRRETKEAKAMERLTSSPDLSYTSMGTAKIV